MVRLGCVPEQGGHPLIWKMPGGPDGGAGASGANR